jgi:ubiquinone/menaquinone biosynthesis C-methylase UbiE
MDESAENLELARAKAAAIKAQVEFRAGQLEALDFEDDAFDLVIADASLVATERLPEILAELVRVAAPHGMVALCLVTASSFGEFFSIYWEALISAGLEEHAPAVETLITERYVVADLERDAAREGLEGVQSWTSKEEFAYESGENFLNAPLIKNFLLEDWLASITDEAERQRVTQEIERLIEEERGGADFVLSIKATLLAGRKFD